MNTYASASDIEKLKIHKNPGEYLHLPDLPLELVRDVLIESPNMYTNIPNPSREVTLFLVRNHGYYLSSVNESDQDEEICIEAIKNYPYALMAVKIGITEEMCREYVLYFLNSRGKIYDVEWIGKVLVYLPEEILESTSFRRFLIDHGVFGFLRLVK